MEKLACKPMVRGRLFSNSLFSWCFFKNLNVNTVLRGALFVCCLWGWSFRGVLCEKPTSPAFSSLKTCPVNVRTGPGLEYPVFWILLRPHWPVKILRQYDYWRYIVDFQGTKGWVHKRFLSSKKTLLLRQNHCLHQFPRDKSPLLAHVEKGVVVFLIHHKNTWCYVQAGHMRGWLPEQVLWGL